MAKKNEIKCGHCGNKISIPGEPALPRLKEATINEIARIGDPDLESLLTFDKEYSARHLVEGFIFATARAINKHIERIRIEASR